MSDFKELLKHSKNYLSADLLTKGLAFVLLPFFTRVMSPSDYGIMSIFSSLLGILTIIYGFGLSSAVSRYYYEKKNDFYSFFSSTISFVFITGLGLTAIGFIFIDEIQSFIKIPHNMIGIALYAAIPYVVYQCYQSYLIAIKNSKKVAQLNILMAIITSLLAIIIILQLNEQKYYAKAIAQATGISILFLITIYSLKNKFTFNLDKKHLKYSLLFGLPVVIHLLSQSTLNTFDQIIINQKIGEYQVGLYSVAYKIGMVQSIFSMAILKAWTPIFYEKMNLGNYLDIDNLASKFTYMVIFIAVSLITFSREILFIFADTSYQEVLSLITVVVVSYFFLFLYTLFVSYSFYFKRTKIISILTVIAGVLNIVLNYQLIPIFGYKVAVWTTLASYLVLFILHYSYVKYRLKAKKIINLALLIQPSLILLLVGIINYYIYVSEMSLGLSIFVRLILYSIVLSFILKKLFKLKYK